MPNLPKVGDVLAGKYRIDRILGEGGMGIVYAAMHLRLRQMFAIKMLQPSALASPEFVQRFEREARAAATLRDPHVVQVHDVDTTPDGLPYIVIELLDGHDLADEIAERGPLPIAEAVGYAVTTCVALAHAHDKGIVHRDLKPSNLYLAIHEGVQTLKLLDFGISKVIDEDKDGQVTSSLQVFGTPFYMSPEQVRSARTVDGRSDIWSLGVVLYQLLTGRVPFEHRVPLAVIAAISADPVPPPRAFRPEIPEDLEAVILKALRKEPDERYPDARAFAMALVPFTADRVMPTFGRSEPRLSNPDFGTATRASSPELAYAQTQSLPSSGSLPALEDPAKMASAGASARPATPAASTGGTLGLPGRSTWSMPAPMRRSSKVVVVAAAGGVALVVVAVLALLRAGPARSARQAEVPAGLVALPSVVPTAVDGSRIGAPASGQGAPPAPIASAAPLASSPVAASVATTVPATATAPLARVKPGAQPTAPTPSATGKPAAPSSTAHPPAEPAPRPPATAPAGPVNPLTL